ncbi:MAG: hypothetical protein AB1861_22190 [Cyanobacteriota bacterium]
MSGKLEHLLAILKQQADLTDKFYDHLDFKYKSTQRIVLDYGSYFPRKIKSPFRGKRKACFENCFRRMLEYPNLIYCEGFSVGESANILIPHAWLVDEQGRLIDPTWTSREVESSTYFGIAFDCEFVMEVAANAKYYGVLDLENERANNYPIMRNGFPPHALYLSQCPLK